jgi:putative DNA primase/helicase
MPTGLHDRQRDNWRPLLAIAERCGGVWPVEAQKAARRISDVQEDEDPAILLLEDFKMLFERNQYRNLSSEEVLHALVRMQDRPWPEFHNGRPITGRGVVQLIGRFKIKARQVAVRGKRPNGYEAVWFEKVWERYLPQAGKSSASSEAGSKL